VTSMSDLSEFIKKYGKPYDPDTDNYDVPPFKENIAGRLENEGRPITAIDSLIAAIALQGNYCLVTRNEHDFQHTGVRIINPWKEA